MKLTWSKYTLFATIIGSTVGIWQGISFFKNQISNMADKAIGESFEAKKRYYEKEVEKVIGDEPINRFVYNSKWIDSLISIYPSIKNEYRVMGMYVNPKTKHRYYVDKDGVEFKVFKDPKGNYYYFDSNINFINP